MKTADLYDLHGDALTLVHLQFRRFGAKPDFAGPIQTVKCFEDNGAVRAELETPGKGRVLVVDGGGATRVALFGDMLAQLSIDNGWAGVVLNGAIRDSADIDAMNQTVFALGTTPVRCVKKEWGEAGTQIAFGGVSFLPGGWVYGDADGVLYSPVRLD